ncbi:hypothetical protein Ddc_01723 [Ditylenchus destructor]|nr:hypothetical protein Ddc_01723 [Ditylenchus destructor]
MASNIGPCSRIAVHQACFEVALFTKVAAIAVFAFNQMDVRWACIMLWILLGIDLAVLAALFLTQVAVVLTVLVLAGIAQTIILGIQAFSESNNHVLKPVFMFNVISLMTVVVLIMLNVIWPVDILSDSEREMATNQRPVAPGAAGRRARSRVRSHNSSRRDFDVEAGKNRSQRSRSSMSYKSQNSRSNKSAGRSSIKQFSARSRSRSSKRL